MWELFEEKPGILGSNNLLFSSKIFSCVKYCSQISFRLFWILSKFSNWAYKKAEIIYTGKQIPGFKWDLRGGTPLVRFDENTYIAITHECYFTPKDINNYKDATYKHRFILWDNEFNIKLITEAFDFMTGDIEFCIGMEIDVDDVYILFGFYDSSCNAIKCNKNIINELIWKKLKPAYTNL